MRIQFLKSVIIAAILLGGFSTTSFAQSPQSFSYQAVARNAAGNIIANQAVSLRFSILDGSASGTLVYQETQSATTNVLGLCNVNVGQGTVTNGTFSTIAWGSGSKFLRVEIDPAGGSSYTVMGTIQMLSVPYALYAANGGLSTVTTGPELSGNGTSGNPLNLAAQGASNGQVLKYNGTQWVPAADAGTTYTAGTGINISGGNVITNTAPDQMVTLTGGGATNVTGTYPNFTVTSTDNNTTYTAGSGIALTGTTFSNNAVTDVTLSGNGTAGTPLKIAQQGANSGQVLKWNGTSWVPGADDDAQTLNINGNQLSISNGNTVTLPAGGGGSLNILSTSITGDNNLSSTTYINLPTVTLTFTPTTSQVFTQFSASGLGTISAFLTNASYVEFRVMVNGVSVGGCNEKVSNTNSWDGFAYSTWSVAFSKYINVNPNVSNTVTVQYRATAIVGINTIGIYTSSLESNHATLTVFNQ